MRTEFYCERCRAALPADDSLFGREVLCPRCREKTALRYRSIDELTKVEQGTAKESENPPRVLETLDSKASSESSGSEPASDQFEFEEFLDDSDLALREAMRKTAPLFEPNPFAISFPLDQYFESGSVGAEAEEAEEESAPPTSYDVDDLIKGVDKPDGGF